MISPVEWYISEASAVSYGDFCMQFGEEYLMESGRLKKLRCLIRTGNVSDNINVESVGAKGSMQSISYRYFYKVRICWRCSGYPSQKMSDRFTLVR